MSQPLRLKLMSGQHVVVIHPETMSNAELVRMLALCVASGDTPRCLTPATNDEERELF